MKIITLNIWGGKLGNELLNFFKEYSYADVFLLQEVYHNATEITAWETEDRREIFREIGEILSEHNGHYAPAESGEWGLASFVKKTINVEEIGDIFVFRHKDAMIGRDGATLGKNLQYIKMNCDGHNFTALNFHGLWNGKGKGDSEDRITQSTNIIKFIKNITGDVVLCGDFNLRPDTESLKMIEKETGLKNLISHHNIIGTRTSHYKKPEKFADYVFISPNIKVKEFKILPEEVSDHAPLFLEF